MKKIISVLAVLASFMASADSTATYHRLSWSVPAESIAAVNATYVNLYAEVGGVRVGSDGRKTPGGGDVGVSTSTVVMGDGGWDWTGKDITQATFAVEFLNNELGVLATVTNAASYADLVAADAFEINGSESFIPANGTTAYAFSGTSVGNDGVYEYLKSIFDDLSATVVPVADGDDNIIDYVISLGSDIVDPNVPLTLCANIGKITIDLKGHDILGTNAVNGITESAAGGNAIEIEGTLATSARGATILEIISDPATGYRGSVVGGCGADGTTGTKGGYAIYSSVAGVTVKVGSTADVIGGASGNSMSTEAPAGQTALGGNATLASGTVTDGQAGTAYDAWAWAYSTGVATDEEVPEGTYVDGEKVWFFKRTADATNPTARATFDFAELSQLAGLDGVIHFVNKKVLVDAFDVPAAVGDLTFVGEENSVLAASGLKSAFTVTTSDDGTRVWTNLAFTCEMPTEAWDQQGAVSFNGGAIHVTGGAFQIADCSFEGLGATQLGGAICAESVDADSDIIRSTFTTNSASLADNGAGGAVYASAVTGSLTLRIEDCSFEGNRAADGGALSTETVVEGDVPFAVDVVDTTFAGNRATYEGGAIFAEGDLYVNTNAVLAALGTTLFTNNFAGANGGAVALNGIVDDTEPALLKMCRGVSFVGNTVSNATGYAAGGAVYSYTEDERIEALGVAFVGNTVYGLAEYGVYGGAIFGDCAKYSVDTCVFDGNTVEPLDNEDWYYGAAIEEENGTLALKNSTFRNQNLEAVDAYNSTVSVTNCVLVGNGTGCDPAIDLNSEDSIVSLAYNAWGTIELNDATPVVDEYNLTNRTTDIYASADSLHLRETGFNAVAALGLPQPGVYDYDEVEYGSLEPGSSMGAFEAGTTAASVNVNGVKIYDGFANSNGVAWTFTTLETDPDLGGLGDVSSLVTVTNWWYGNKNAGDFAATNAAPQNLDAAVDGNTDEIRRWIAAGLIAFTYDGTIERRDIALGGLTVVLTPDEYRWTGSKVVAQVVVTDTLPAEDETLVEDVDYALSCSSNINPTASANAKIDTLRNYFNATNLAYAITAYFIEYAFDDEVDESLTETIGETSGVAVVKADIAEKRYGYVFDKYYSPTNGTVRRADHTDGLLRLQVLYCTDANADGVPDKYQRKILAKVVKGEWSTVDGTAVKNGSDVELWSTLWKDGKWDASGTGTVDGTVPTAGTRSDGGYSAGGWLGFDASGNLVKVTDPATFEFSASKVPFLIYVYSHTAGTSSETSGRGRGTSRSGSTTKAEATDLLEQYTALMSVENATFTGTQLKLKTKLVISGPESSSTEVPVSDTELKLYFVEKLGNDWQTLPCVTDESGVITVDLTEKSGFYKVGL